MLSPFDWQEGIGNRAAYVENKLKHGSPVLAVSLGEGILVYTRRKQGRKIFEVYDRLLFTAIGQQGDVESMRTAAVDFAHQEGYQRAEEDVTVQRVVTALSQPVKRAFGDFNTAPYVIRALFAEVGEHPDQDRFFVLDYDGDYQPSRHSCALSGVEDWQVKLLAGLKAIGEKEADAAVAALRQLWLDAQADDPLEGDWQEEAVLLRRDSVRENHFSWLLGSEV